MILLEKLKEEKNSPLKIVLRAALAYAALLSLRMHYAHVGGLETGNFLIDNLSIVSNQFSNGGISDLLIFAAIYIMCWYVEQKEHGFDIWTLLLSFVFALLYSIANMCRGTGNLALFYANGYSFCISMLSVIGHWVIFYPALRLFYFALESNNTKEEKAILHPFRTAVVIMLLCWLPWLLMNYPGSFCSDSLNQLSQFFHINPWSSHHPPFSSAIIGLCVKLGILLFDANLGIFLYLLFQSIVGAVIISAGLSLLYKHGLSRRLWIVFVLFFAINPFWGCFMQWLDKDLLYAEMFALCLVLLIPVIKDRRCSTGRAICIASAALTAVLLRKTGQYELLPLFFVLVLWLRKSSRLRLLAATLAVIVLSSCVNNVLYPALGIKEASVAEALSIPFQQTARYVNEYPDEVTEEERAAIAAVLDYDKLDQYKADISDPIKATYHGSGKDMANYLKVWLQMLFKHPICYFEAGFMISYGYLAPGEAYIDAYISSVYNNKTLSAIGVYRVFGDFPTRVFDSVREMFFRLPLTTVLCMCGVYTWIFMACFVQLLRKKRYSAMLLLIPGIFNVLICIASPLYYSTRYELPVIITTPLILGWTILHSKNKESA